LSHLGRILVVEDEGDMALVLQHRLKAVGYDVHTEGFGSTALSYAVEHQPRLVILDINLPDLGGYAVCQELRKMFPRTEVAVLMFTGLNGPIDDIYSYASGADAFVTKSIAPAELLKLIQELMSKPAEAVASAVTPRFAFA
jgi:two-component system OmpR family response regulator